MDIRELTEDDIPAAMELSTLAGWNQTPADWRALLDVSPDLCLGIECDGRLAATTTLVCYETRLAWIGMVLTHPEYRRRGYARALVKLAVELAHDRSVATIKLDATDLGRPLYYDLGFRDEQPVERWGTDTVDAPGPLEVPQFNEPGGYLLHRPGVRAHYLGPIVADGPATAERLVRRAIEEIAAPRYFWDLLPANRNAANVATRLGFAPVRRLMRMVLGPNPPRDESTIYGIAGFEWG
jgi:RimJ/RimL family protein N-acetyltransferase